MKYILKLIFEGIVITVIAGVVLAVVAFALFFIFQDKIEVLLRQLIGG